jgi:hypothetical protein
MSLYERPRGFGQLVSCSAHELDLHVAPVIPHHRPMPAIASTPVFAASIVARLPLR